MMARSIDFIQAQIIANVQAQPELSAASSTSKRAIWRLWTYVVAVAINVLEQLQDLFKSDLELTASKAAPGSPAWLQDKVFKFQYDATTPQIVQLVNTIPVYPTIDATKRIITRCSVKTDLSNNVKVKVAKSDPPVALSGGELSALQSYVNILGFAGINYVVSSANADQLYISATVYYQGQYSAVILANITEAIGSFLADLSLNNFDGSMKISDLENAIRNTIGVNDVVLSNVRVRRDADSFTAGTDLVLSQQTIARLWNTVAGYLVLETTSGKTLADSLTLISQ